MAVVPAVQEAAPPAIPTVQEVWFPARPPARGCQVVPADMVGPREAKDLGEIAMPWLRDER